MNRALRPLVPVALLAAALLSGCAATHRVNFELPPGHTAGLEVLGERPRITIDNSGPGPVSVEIAGGGTDVGERFRLGAATTRRTLEGPVRLRLETGPQARARVRVTTKGASGVAVTTAPTRAGP